MPVEKPVPFTIEKKVPYPIIIPVKKPQYHHTAHHHDLHHHHGHHDPHHHLSTYDHHTEFTHNKYQQVSAQRPQSSEQSASSSSSSSSSSGEYQEYVPRLEAPASSQQEQTKLFSPSQQSGNPYSQQHQLHHQQQYAQLRRDLLTRERMRSSSEESEAESTEFRPIMSSQSAEFMSPSNNVETVVAPPPPNQQTRSSFHINVPNEEATSKETTSTSGQTSNNQFTHNIEIPVHFYRLQPIENGEGFEIAS